MAAVGAQLASLHDALPDRRPPDSAGRRINRFSSLRISFEQAGCQVFIQAVLGLFSYVLQALIDLEHEVLYIYIYIYAITPVVRLSWLFVCVEYKSRILATSSLVAKILLSSKSPNSRTFFNRDTESLPVVLAGFSTAPYPR